MRVLLVSQYFISGEQSGGSRHAELADFLRGRGHSVVVVTSGFDNFRKARLERYRGRLFTTEKEDGREIVRVWTLPNRRGSFRSRYGNYASFVATAVAGGFFAKRPDVVVASSPPLPAAFAGYLLSRAHRAPFVLEIRDLWPDAAIHLKVMRPGRAADAAMRLERFLYRKARAIVTISPGLRRYLLEQKGVEAEKTFVITQGVRMELYAGAAAARTDRKPDRPLRLIYAGAVGVNNAMEPFFEAADRLRTDRRFAFAVVGDGDLLEHFREVCRAREIDNLEFIPPVPKKEMGRVLSGADLGFLALQPFYSDCALPNKVFDYLGAGMPLIVLGGGGDVDRLLGAAGSGQVARENTAAALISILEAYAGEPDRLRREAKAARRFAEDNLGWENVLQGYEELLHATVEGRRPASSGGASEPADEAARAAGGE